VILAAFGAGFLRVARRSPPAPFAIAHVRVQAEGPPLFRSRFLSSRQNVQAHAASAVELHDGRIRAFWYAGSHEGAPDVEVRTAVFDPDRGAWGEERVVASAQTTQASVRRFVRRIGNAVAAHAADGSLHLFYVTGSVGGWVGSSVTTMTSHDEGETWGPARRLITSPFLNLSTLVRSGPFLYADGTMGVPVYHEFVAKFGELLRLDASGTVVDKQRLGAAGSGLQPVVLTRGPREALVLLRNGGSARPRRVLGATTVDAGGHWTEPLPTSLANPDAAVSGIVLADGRIVVALNDVEDARERLSLVISDDGGKEWRTIYRLEDERERRDQPSEEEYSRTIEAAARASDASVEDPKPYATSVKRVTYWGGQYHFEFSYPYLIETKRGFHVLYTWNKGFIKDVEFNRAWLDERMAEASDAGH
jgi:predicted neuraminidase